MAAARASLLEVLTPDAYEHLNKLNDHMMAGCDAILKKYDLPGYTVGISSKGCVTFSPVEITDYESFKANQDGETDRAGLALRDEPRHLHDAGPRRGMDALRPALDRGLRQIHRRCSRNSATI